MYLKTIIYSTYIYYVPRFAIKGTQNQTLMPACVSATCKSHLFSSFCPTLSGWDHALDKVWLIKLHILRSRYSRAFRQHTQRSKVRCPTQIQQPPCGPRAHIRTATAHCQICRLPSGFLSHKFEGGGVHHYPSWLGLLSVTHPIANLCKSGGAE